MLHYKVLYFSIYIMCYAFDLSKMIWRKFMCQILKNSVNFELCDFLGSSAELFKALLVCSSSMTFSRSSLFATTNSNPCHRKCVRIRFCFNLITYEFMKIGNMNWLTPVASCGVLVHQRHVLFINIINSKQTEIQILRSKP